MLAILLLALLFSSAFGGPDDFLVKPKIPGNGPMGTTGKRSIPAGMLDLKRSVAYTIDKANRAKRQGKGHPYQGTCAGCYHPGNAN